MHIVDETIDVLDEQGNVTGSMLWSEVHAKGLKHKTVAIFLFRDETKKEVLMQRRSMTMRQEPGKLTLSAGGHVVSGESLEEGIRKEIAEELFHGVVVPEIPIHYLTKVELKDMPGNVEDLSVFEGICPGPFVIDPGEVSEVFWKPWDEVVSECRTYPERFTIAFSLILETYLKLCF